MRLSLCVAAFSAAVLSACVAPSVTPVSMDLSQEALAASGQAVLVSRGSAFAELGAETGRMELIKYARDGFIANVLSNRDLLPTSDYGYKVQTVPAGFYQLGNVTIGRLANNNKDPLSGVQLAAGDVVYLGDIELRPQATGLIGRNAVATLTDRTANAKAALAAQAPGLTDAMRTELLTCTICIKQ